MNGLITGLRKIARKNHFLRVILGQYLPSTGWYDGYFKSFEVSRQWKKRIDDVISCKDNEKISRVKNAGEIIHGKQVMHNGVLVNVGSYYGPEVARLLIENRGVHEPQEEYVFGEVLKELSDNSLMIELGSFWSFYSIWFGKTISSAQNYMIEPDKFNIISGKRNFQLNKLQGNFTNAFVGEKTYKKPSEIGVICVDDFIKEKSISHIQLLHSDIQGAELDMLKGASDSLNRKKIDYIFISTHSDKLHYSCIDFLVNYDYQIIVESDLKNTFSEDGLIVAKRKDLLLSRKIEIDQKNK